MKNKRIIYLSYQVFIAILAIITIVMLLAYYAGDLNLDAYPYNLIDSGIWAVFVVDYLVRFARAKDKKYFFTHNLFDLLSIIPASSIFAFFRVAQIGRTFRMLKMLRIARLVGLTGRLASLFKRSEFLYYLYISIAVILVAAAMFRISEKFSFNEALWWAITTATTIGYGDITPKTGLGRGAAIILMFLGIGFIGMLTSTITEYFAKEDEEKVGRQLDRLENENRQLKHELDEVKALLIKQSNDSNHHQSA
jgi:voltage-gated potassium channel